MKYMALTTIALVALAGCKKEPSVKLENASAAEVAAKVKEAGGVIKMQPGAYETTMSIDSMEVPGLKDPKAIEAMKQMQTKMSGMKSTACVTPEQVANPDPKMFAANAAPGCKFDRFSMQGGKISYQMSCQQPGGNMTAKANADGSITSTGFDMAVQNTVNSPQIPGGAMTTKARLSSKRTGECKPGMPSSGSGATPAG